jgi:Ca2+-binding RTX toxin-like protein
MLRPRHSVRGALVGLAFVFTLGIALTATNVVPASRAGSTNAGAPTANQLKPPQCAALDLSNVVVGSGTVVGTGAGDLIIGSPGPDTLRGKGVSDCILGGAGDDFLKGEGGNDVCIGGPGLDTFAACRTQIQ